MLWRIVTGTKQTYLEWVTGHVWQQADQNKQSEYVSKKQREAGPGKP